MVKMLRKSLNLLAKSLFWTSKQPFAIRSFIASYDVCPLLSQKSERKRKDPITGNSFIVSVFAYAYAQAFDLSC